MRKKIVSILVFLFVLAVSVNGVWAAKVTLLGAGATFPYPLYAKWFDVYYKKTGVKVNYQAIGSGGGIRQLLARTVDFGATDAPMSDEELAKAPGKIVHIPMALGAVVVAYNVPRVKSLRLTPKVLADIFLGKIQYWDNPMLKKVNPGVHFPHLRIVVAHRSDGSGTTYNFTNYLAKVSPEWREKVGYGKAVRWPTGVGGKGNAGVAGLIRQIPGCIGYIELAYAVKNHIPVAALQNKAGHFVRPTLKAISAAANIDIPDDTRCSLTNTSAPYGYPITAMTWIIVYKEQAYGGRSYKKAKALADLLWWCIHDAQNMNEKLLYGRIPARVVVKAERILKGLTYQGSPLLP